MFNIENLCGLSQAAMASRVLSLKDKIVLITGATKVVIDYHQPITTCQSSEFHQAQLTCPRVSIR